MAKTKKNTILSPNPETDLSSKELTGYSARALRYAEDILSGLTPSCWKVRLACQRFLDDLQKDSEGWQYTYSDQKANRFCRIAEVFPHEKGELQGQAVRLGDFQCFIFCNIFGWINRETSFRRFREALVVIPRGNGKALALDTPIPTPAGWSTQGSLRVGDEIFDEAGRITRVLMAHPVEVDRKCYRVGFSDGSSIVANAEHEWYVEARRNGMARQSRKTHRTWKQQNLRTTEEIARTYVLNTRTDGSEEKNYRIPVAGALETLATELPVAPYTLGAWLGDGDSDCAQITIGPLDQQEMSALLAADGSPVRKKDHYHFTFALGGRNQKGRERSLGGRLRRAGLLGNKHIPKAYLRASQQQRLALLRGLMDTDGSCAKNGQCEFTGTNERLCRDVKELILSLGYKPTVLVGRSMLDGVDYGPKFRVCFYPNQSLNPFAFQRKALRVREKTQIARFRQIVACDEVYSVPVRCITVDSPNSLYLAGESMIPTHNSPMAAWVTNYMAFFDKEPGSEVYNAATSLDQAQEVFRPAKAIIEMVPALQKKYGIQANASNLYQPSTRSRVLPVIGRPKDGKAPHCVTNDEYHEQADNLLYDSFKRGMNKRRQSLMFNITTAGDTIEGPCYRMQKELEAILKREFDNERFFGIVYDAEKEENPPPNDDFWTTREACVIANPNFGVSIDEEAFLADLADAIRDSSKQNGFRCKNQNFWAQATSAWMNMTYWDRCAITSLKEESFKEHLCALGSDLASTLDLSATIKLFVRPRPSDGKPIYTAFCRAYLPKSKVFDKSRPLFQKWGHDGSLIATEGNAIDYKKIEDDTVADIETYRVSALCFDQRYAGQYAQQVAARTGVQTVVIPPSADQLSPAMKELEAAVADGRFEHDGHPVLRWCMANVLARSNQATGNYHMPGKDRPEKKIDLAVALFIAIAHARTLLQQAENYIESDDLWFVDED